MNELKMKSLEEIANDLKNVKMEIKETKKKSTLICNSTDDFSDSEIETLKYLEEKVKNLKLKERYLLNNGRVALFHEVVPVAVTVLKKWVNKPLGERTKEKITNEIKELTGSRFRVHNGVYSSGRISCYSCDFPEFGFECLCNNNGKKLLIGNKIQEVSFEDFHLYHNNYIYDIDKCIEQLIEAFNKIQAIHTELGNACNEYNNLTVDGIDCMYTGHIKSYIPIG